MVIRHQAVQGKLKNKDTLKNMGIARRTQRSVESSIWECVEFHFCIDMDILNCGEWGKFNFEWFTITGYQAIMNNPS